MKKKDKRKEMYTLSTAQKKSIAEAREQFRNGNFLTNYSANKEVNKWLNEKK
jgi:hypothetical protein